MAFERAKTWLDLQARDKTKEAFLSMQKSMSKTSDTMNRLARVGGTILAGGTIARLAMASDRMNALRIRTETATKQTGDFNRVWEQLLLTTARTGNDMQDAVGTFQNLSRVQPSLEASTNMMLELTRTVQELGVIGGSTTQQMKFGMRQFNQAMSQPMFRAEEFNSILENIPEVAARIAKGMGTTPGHLRNLVLEGKLASKEVFEVLLKQAEGIHDEFENIPMTLQRAAAGTKTIFLEGINNADRYFDITESIAEVWGNINDMIRESYGLLTGSELEQRNALAKKRVEDEQANLEVLYAQRDALQAQVGDAGFLSREFSEEGRQLREVETAIRNAVVEQARWSKEAKETAMRLDVVKQQAEAASAIPEGGPSPEEKAAQRQREEAENLKILKESLEQQYLLHIGAGDKAAQLKQQYADKTAAYDKKKAKEALDAQLAMLFPWYAQRQTLEYKHQEQIKDLKLQKAREEHEAYMLLIQGFGTAEAQQKAQWQEQRDQVARDRLIEQREWELMIARGYNSQEEMEEAEHEARLLAIIEASEDAKLAKKFESAGRYQKLLMDISEWEKKDAVEKANFTLATTSKAFAGLAQKSRKAFEINKAASIAQTIMSTSTAVMKAYEELGPVAGSFAAAAIIAEGAGRLQQIRSTRFGGGAATGGSAIGGGSGIPSQAPSEAQPPFLQPVNGFGRSGGPQVVVNVQGNVVGNQDFIDSLIEDLTRFVNADGIIINAGTAQSLELGGG